MHFLLALTTIAISTISAAVIPLTHLSKHSPSYSRPSLSVPKMSLSPHRRYYSHPPHPHPHHRSYDVSGHSLHSSLLTHPSHDFPTIQTLTAPAPPLPKHFQTPTQVTMISSSGSRKSADGFVQCDLHGSIIRCSLFALLRHGQTYFVVAEGKFSVSMRPSMRVSVVEVRNFTGRYKETFLSGEEVVDVEEVMKDAILKSLEEAVDE